MDWKEVAINKSLAARCISSGNEDISGHYMSIERLLPYRDQLIALDVKWNAT